MSNWNLFAAATSRPPGPIWRDGDLLDAWSRSWSRSCFMAPTHHNLRDQTRDEPVIKKIENHHEKQSLRMTGKKITPSTWRTKRKRVTLPMNSSWETHGPLASGKLTVCDIENGPVEIVDLPINSMVMFQFVMSTFTRPGNRPMNLAFTRASAIHSAQDAAIRNSVWWHPGCSWRCPWSAWSLEPTGEAEKEAVWKVPFFWFFGPQKSIKD